MGVILAVLLMLLFVKRKLVSDGRPPRGYEATGGQPQSPRKSPRGLCAEETVGLTSAAPNEEEGLANHGAGEESALMPNASTSHEASPTLSPGGTAIRIKVASSPSSPVAGA